MQVVSDLIKKALCCETNHKYSGVVNTSLEIKIASDNTTTWSGTNLVKLEATHDFSFYLKTDLFLASFVVKMKLDPLLDSEYCDFKNTDIHELSPIFWADESLDEDYPPEYEIYDSSYKEVLKFMTDSGSFKTQLVSILNYVVSKDTTVVNTIFMNFLHEENKKALNKAIKTQQQLLETSLLGM